MLIDISGYRKELPANVTVFASGANQVSEILGFQKLSIPVGVAVNHLSESAIEAICSSSLPVMVDSGAFSEVSFTDQGPQIEALISDTEWRQRLAVYLRIAVALGPLGMLVVPDLVGNQNETLSRLKRYRKELCVLARTGATLLLPLQVGNLSHAEFHSAACESSGVVLTPAMPMRKAVTSVECLLNYVREACPEHVHLLGIGIDNRKSGKLIRMMQNAAPGITISMDSNRIRAVTGMGRPMTIREHELRSMPTDAVYGSVDSSVLDLAGRSLDYTDSIAFPGAWCSDAELMAVSHGAILSEDQERAFLSDPDAFLQSPYAARSDLTWLEHPLMAQALDSAWERYVTTSVRTSVRTAAIIDVFRSSPICGQAAA